MKTLALIITILGILVLLFILNVQQPIKINSSVQLDFLQENQKVFIIGKVIDERIIGQSKLLTLENNITIICNCPKSKSYKNKNISVIGYLDLYLENKQISALKIKES